MKLFSERTKEAWIRFSEKKRMENLALVKLWELRDDPIEDTSLFLMPQHEMPDAKVEDHFTAGGKEYKIEHINYDHLFVRQL